MIKNLLLITLIFFVNYSYGGVLDSIQSIFDKSSKKYQNYECQTETDTKSCNKNCKPMVNTYYKFKISKSDSFIFKDRYHGNERIDSETLKNCVIIDSENWECTSIGRIVDRMSDGIYTFWSMSDGIYTFLNYCSK